MNILFMLFNAPSGAALFHAEYKKFIYVKYHNLLKNASFFQKFLYIFRGNLQSVSLKSILDAQITKEEL